MFHQFSYVEQMPKGDPGPLYAIFSEKQQNAAQSLAELFDLLHVLSINLMVQHDHRSERWQKSAQGKASTERIHRIIELEVALSEVLDSVERLDFSGSLDGPGFRQTNTRAVSKFDA